MINDKCLKLTLITKPLTIVISKFKGEKKTFRKINSSDKGSHKLAKFNDLI